MLYLIIILTFVFRTWIAAPTLATLEALSHLCEHITRLLHKPPPPPFRFLDLPPEIRNMVYHHHLNQYKERWHLPKAGDKAMLPDAILSASRQVYEEDSHSLFSPAIVNIKIASAANVQSDGRPVIGSMRKIAHVLVRTRTVYVEIFWPRAGVEVLFKGRGSHERAVADVKRHFKSLCTSLAKLPNLRTINVVFFLEEYSDFWMPLWPPECRLLGLLRPLELVRRANPQVRIEMSEGCASSRIEWAKKREEWPLWPELVKHLVDCVIGDLGDWSESREREMGMIYWDELEGESGR